MASLSAVAGVIALTLFLAGVFDGDDAAGAGAGGPESAALCAEGSPDCDDALVESDGTGDDGDGAVIEPGCALGFPDCNDTPVSDDEAGEPVEGEDGISIAPMCAVDSPDCGDMIVNGDIDDAVPSVEPLVPADSE